MSILWLRKRTKLIFYVTVVAFGTFIFSMWGAQLSMNRGPNAAENAGIMAKVYDQSVSAEAFYELYDQTIKQYRQYFGDQLDEKMTNNVREQALNQLVDEILVQEEVKTLGIKATAEEINSFTKAQLIGEDQKIDPATLDQWKKNPEMLLYLERMARQNITNQKVVQWIGESVKVSPVEVKFRYRMQNEKVTIKGISLMAEKFGKDFVPDEERLKSYYDGHQKVYERPIRRNISLVSFEHQPFLDQVEVSENEIGDYYDAHKEDFWRDEFVKGQQILVRVQENKEEEARLKVEEAKKRIDAGEPLALVAETASDWKVPNGDLGELTRDRAESSFGASFVDMVFSMAPGTLSDVFRGEKGYHLVFLQDHKQQGYLPIDAVREEIVASVKMVKALDLAEEKAKAFRDAAKEKGWSETATADGLQLQETGYIAEKEMAPELAGFEGAQKFAFSCKPGETGDPVRGSDVVLVFKALEERAKGVAPFEEVREEVLDAVKLEEGKTRAVAAAKTVKESLASGQGWEAAIKGLQEVKVEESEPFSLYSPYGSINISGFPGSDLNLAKKAFALNPGEFSEVVEGDMGCTVFEVAKRDEPDWNAFDGAKETETLFSEKMRDAYAKWVDSLREKAKKDGKLDIIIDPKNLT